MNISRACLLTALFLLPSCETLEPWEVIDEATDQEAIDSSQYEVTEEEAEPEEPDGRQPASLLENDNLVLASLFLAPTTPTDNDTYTGVCRKVAKLSYPTAPKSRYKSITTFLKARPTDAAMQAKSISRGHMSARVDEEKRLARIKGWILASNRPTDNDYHVILGDHPTDPTVCMNVEVSGLADMPADDSYTTEKQAKRLAKVRKRYKNAMGTLLPGKNYKLYSPGIPVLVTGGLLYDSCHVPGQVGPTKWRPKLQTCWELHPVTWITFK